MKLYATTTSERASKGQGGNEYIRIKINGEEDTLLYLDVKPVEGGYRLWINIKDKEGGLVKKGFYETIPAKTKGKKQKSEKGKYNICESFGCGNATEEPDGEYCAFH